ncbi:hypothetical protein [Trueperella bernardiae]|uniref:hypothetical protein n=1 Tax=Trueperella bernardiae TaxID=59561 RepID=UPI0023F57939|nr:hypothetical protein [Trueperella bernardiae]
MWFWILLIGLTALAVYLGYTLRDVWRSAKRLGTRFGELSRVADAMTAPERERPPLGDLYADPERVREAREQRRRIRAERTELRRCNLAAARERWDELDETSFDSIGPEARERARQRVKGHA